ncbi:hypothetical protein HYQ46_005146 [Verticillium longisporum]|nr:hypothetical protein HYQ46_005146 [Verticillium longisporum]
MADDGVCDDHGENKAQVSRVAVDEVQPRVQNNRLAGDKKGPTDNDHGDIEIDEPRVDAQAFEQEADGVGHETKGGNAKAPKIQAIALLEGKEDDAGEFDGIVESYGDEDDDGEGGVEVASRVADDAMIMVVG